MTNIPSTDALAPASPLVSALLPDAVSAQASHGSVVLVPVQEPEPPPGKGPEFGNASPIGLVVVLLLLIATVLLIRSMSKRIRRLPESFDGDAPNDGGPGDGGPDDGGPRSGGTADGGPADGGIADGESGDGSTAGSSQPGAR